MQSRRLTPGLYWASAGGAIAIALGAGEALAAQTNSAAQPPVGAALIGGLTLLCAALIGGVKGPWFRPEWIIMGMLSLLTILHPLSRFHKDAYSAGVLLVYDPQGNLEIAALILGLGALAMMLGVVYARGGPASFSFHIWLTPVRRRASQFAIEVCLLLVVAACLTLLAQRVGVQTLLGGRTEVEQFELQQASGYLYLSPYILVFPALFRLISTERPLSIAGLWGLLLLGISQILAIGGGDRISLLPTAVTLLAMAWMRWPWLRSKRSSIVMLCIIGILVVVPRLSRQANDAYLVKTNSNSAISVAQDVFSGNDSGMLDDLSILVGSESKTWTSAWGASYVGALARPVPRSLWTAKPGSFDQVANAAILPDQLRKSFGFSFTMFGEAYFNFGWAGVVLIPFTVGWAFGVAYRRLLRVITGVPWVSLATSIPYLMVFIRGSISGDYQRLVLVLVPVGLYVIAGVNFDVHRRFQSGP